MQPRSCDPTQSIRVLLADDHAVVRKGIRDFLEADPQICVIAEAEDGANAWQQLVGAAPPRCGRPRHPYARAERH